MGSVKEMPGNAALFFFSFFLEHILAVLRFQIWSWRRVECTPTLPPTAYWQNTRRFSSTGLTVNAPPGTGDTFNHNQFDVE